jgi:hypothetical protein
MTSSVSPEEPFILPLSPAYPSSSNFFELLQSWDQ